MHFVRIARTAAVLLFLGAVVPANARQDQNEDKKDKPAKHQDKQEQRGKSERHPSEQHARPANQQGQHSGQAMPQQHPYRSQQQATAWQQQKGWRQQGAWQGNKSWQRSRASQWDSQHRSWVQRGGYGGYYIPQDRFSVYFGSQHLFRIQSRPVMYNGYPRFDYHGFSFLLVDPWPEHWRENWYEIDDVYIDYDNGYYLHNRRQPGIRLAITVAI